MCCADTCPATYSTKASGFAQIVSPHSAATVTLKMTTAGVVVFTSSGPGHCQAGVLVNIVVSQGNMYLLLLRFHVRCSMTKQGMYGLGARVTASPARHAVWRVLMYAFDIICCLPGGLAC